MVTVPGPRARSRVGDSAFQNRRSGDAGAHRRAGHRDFRGE